MQLPKPPRSWFQDGVRMILIGSSKSSRAWALREHFPALSSLSLIARQLATWHGRMYDKRFSAVLPELMTPRSLNDTYSFTHRNALPRCVAQAVYGRSSLRRDFSCPCSIQ